MDEGVAVHLRGGGEQEARALRLRQPERLVGAEGADFQGRDRMLEVVHRTRRAREVQDGVQGPLDLDEVRHVVQDELEVVVAPQVGDIGGVPGQEVVHPDHAVALGQEPVTQVRAQEPRRARYEDAHARGRPMLS